MNNSSYQIAIKLSNKHSFSPTLLPTIATVILITLFLHLSHWQWSKAEKRRQLEQQLQSAEQLHFNNINELVDSYAELGLGLSDATATLRGKFAQTPLIIWDNRIYNRQSGYFIIALFEVDNEKGPQRALLPINLGWVPLINNRRELIPNAILPTQHPSMTVTGSLFTPHADRFVLNDQVTVLDSSSITSAKGKYPIADQDTHQTINQHTPLNKRLLVQRFDSHQLSTMIGKPIHPFILRADSISETVKASHQQTWVRDWQPRKEIGISADKHLGYALQWLTFSIILLGLYIGLNIVPTTHGNTDHY